MAYTLENMHDDVASVFAYARANYKLDEDRIGMLGYSMGGRVTSLYLSEEKIGTTVLWAPAAADGLKSLTSMGDEETIRKLIEESGQRCRRHPDLESGGSGRARFLSAIRASQTDGQSQRLYRQSDGSHRRAG